jgi:hypothetical protein
MTSNLYKQLMYKFDNLSFLLYFKLIIKNKKFVDYQQTWPMKRKDH